MKNVTAIAVFVAASGIAQAEMIEARFTGTQKGSTVRVTSPDLTGNTFAGQLKYSLSDGPEDIIGDWVTFCSDLAQRTNGSDRWYDIVPVSSLPGSAPMGEAKADAIRDLYIFSAGSQLTSTTSNNLATAFQLAVWEIINDFDANAPGYNLSITSGLFSATKTNGDALPSGITTELNSLFGAVGNTPNAPVSLMGLRSGSYQDQLIPIPAPGTAALAGLGALCFISRRRDR